MPEDGGGDVDGQTGVDGVGGEEPAEIAGDEPDRGAVDVAQAGAFQGPLEPVADGRGAEHLVAAAGAALEQVRQRRSPGPFEGVVAGAERDGGVVAADPLDDLRERVGQLRGDREDALGVHLRRGDLQQRDDLAVGLGVAADRQVGQFHDLFDAQPGQAHDLDDGPRPEGLVLLIGRVDHLAVGLAAGQEPPHAPVAVPRHLVGGAVGDDPRAGRLAGGGAEQGAGVLAAGPGRGTEGGDELGQGPGASVHPRDAAGLVLVARVDVGLADGAGRCPGTPAGRVLVGPLADVEVEGPHAVEDRVPVVAGDLAALAVDPDGDPLLPGRGGLGDRAAASAAPFYAQGADNNFGREGRAVGWMLDRIGQRCDELGGQAEHVGKQLVDIELELADLIAAERVVGCILAGPGAGSGGFHVADELVFQPV